MRQNKKIYIIISQTGTILSRILKLITGKTYNHASISLDKELDEMYSFGRLNPYNPFWGGFVHESIYYGTFKRFYNTESLILEIDVDDKEFEKLRDIIYNIDNNKKFYKYNTAGLILCAIHIPYHRERSYYCSEFVKDMLVQTSIIDSKDLPSMIHPMDFLSIPHNNVYQGKLRDYTYKTKAI